MRNLYPLFERNRILKKELLWSLRDYSFAHAWLEYQEYSPGIVKGCGIQVTGDAISVSPGIVKTETAICLLMEEERIPFRPAEGIQILNLHIRVNRSSPDYIAYEMGLALEREEKGEEEKREPEKRESEKRGQAGEEQKRGRQGLTGEAQDRALSLELCRFHLRKGASLRNSYKNFRDMETEYDTVNLIHSQWSGLRGPALAPAVTGNFARALLEKPGIRPEDRSFACLLLSQPGAVPMEVLEAYLEGKGERRPDGRPMSREAAYRGLRRILEQGEWSGERERDRQRRPRILVD